MQLSLSAGTGGRSQLGNRLSSLCSGKGWWGWGNLQGVSSKRPLLIWDAFMTLFHFPNDSHFLGPPLDGSGPPREKVIPTLGVTLVLHTLRFGAFQPSRNC